MAHTTFTSSRLKFPGSQGFFTASWMLPADPSSSYSHEIDIIEVLGHNPKQTYHYNNRSTSYTPNKVGAKNGARSVIDYSANFHSYAVDWQPDHVAWYIDGIKCGQFDGSG